jgi:hypothetical protein
MLAIAVPSLALVPVMTNRLAKPSRCSQQPQPIKRLVPAPSGRKPLVQAQGRQPTGTVDGGHKVQPSSPSHHCKQNRSICTLTQQGHLGCITRA